MTQKKPHNVVTKNPSDPSNKKRDRDFISDGEINSYLHSTKETELKKMIWELINKDELKRRKLQKQPIKENKQKSGSAKEAAKIGAVGKNMEKKREFSSKINYAALKEVMDDEESDLGNQKNEEVERESEWNEVGDVDESERDEVGDLNEGNWEYDSDDYE